MKTTGRGKKNGEAQNVVIIDVDSDCFSNVENLGKKLQGSNSLKSDNNVSMKIYVIDDDDNVIPEKEGQSGVPVEGSVVNDREKLKVTDNYMQTLEDELSATQRAIRVEAEEAQQLERLLKRKIAEKLRLLDTERRQKQVIEEIRETQAIRASENTSQQSSVVNETAFKRALEEKISARQRALKSQAEEAKRKTTEKVSTPETERSQKRVEKLTETKKKVPENSRQPQVRKKRSVSMVEDRSKNKQKLEIEFDEFGQPIGVNQSKFATYVGVKTRTMISILKPTWKQVPKPDIDKLWLKIKENWSIRDDNYKKQVLKIGNQAWRAYKWTLVKKFLNKGKDPVPIYPYLDKSTWQRFVALKLTKEFQKISEKGTASAKQNKNPARLGPRGYRGMKAQWEKERESSMSTIHQIQDERTRDYILARRKRIAPGVYKLPTKLQPLADDLMEKDVELAQGGEGGDPLIEVLGPEHPGRTRAVGHIVGLKQSLCDKKRKRCDKECDKKSKRCDADDLDDIVSRKVEEKMGELKSKLQSDMEVQMHMFRQQMMSRTEGIPGGRNV